MPLLALLLDLCYDATVYWLTRDKHPIYYLSARLLVLVLRLVTRFTRRPRREPFPLLEEFSPEDQRHIIQTASEALPKWITFPDFERVEWLNTAIARMWLPCSDLLSHFCSTRFERFVNNAIEHSFNFKFEALTMGTIPLRLVGIKMYKDGNLDRKEIMLDVEMYYNGNAEFACSVAGIRAGIKNVQLRGVLRVILKPILGQVPLIGGIEFFFLNPPTVDFEMTNLLIFPGMKGTVHRLVHEQLKSMMVLPNRQTFLWARSHVYNDVMFVMPKGVLRVHLIAARDILAPDTGPINPHDCSPYVKLQLGAREEKSKPVRKNVNPIWDQMFDFVVTEPEGQILSCEIVNEENEQLLGSVRVSSAPVLERETTDQWYDLESGTRTQLHLRLQWLNLSANKDDLSTALHECRYLGPHAESPLSCGILIAVLDSAENLPRSPGKDIPPNPKAILTLDSQTWKSRTCTRTCDPVWEQQHMFYVSNPLMQKFTVTIINCEDRQRLGLVTIPLLSVVETTDLVVDNFLMLMHSGPEARIRFKVVLRIVTSREMEERYRRESGSKGKGSGGRDDSVSSQATKRFYV